MYFYPVFSVDLFPVSRKEKQTMLYCDMQMLRTSTLKQEEPDPPVRIQKCLDWKQCEHFFLQCLWFIHISLKLGEQADTVK